MHPLAPQDPWEGGPLPGEEYPTDPDAQAAQLEDLRAQLRSHPSKAAYYAWDGASRAYAIWEANGLELRSALLLEGVSERDRVAMMFTGPEQDRLWALLDQRLLNMTAAAASLAEKTRDLAEHYPGSAFAKEYTTRHAAMRAEGVTMLIERLRNYLLHPGGFASIRANSNLREVDGEAIVDTALYIETEPLLAADTWFKPKEHAAARDFLKAHPDIDLLDLLAMHVVTMGALYRWAFAQHHSLEAANLAEVADLRRRINLTRSMGRNYEAEAAAAFAESQAEREAAEGTD